MTLSLWVSFAVTVTVTGSGIDPQADPDMEEWLATLDVLPTDDDVVTRDVLSEDVDVVVMGILSEEVEVVAGGACFEDVEVVMMGVLSEDVELILVDELLTMLVLTTIVELTDFAGQSVTSEEQLVTVIQFVLVTRIVEGSLSVVVPPYCPFAALVSRATDRADRAHDGFASSMAI